MILYHTDSNGKVLSIMVTSITETNIESISPYHELRRTRRLVVYDEQMNYWVLCIPFDGQFHDVSQCNIYEEHMRKFYLHHCYNVKDRKVILC